MGLWGGLLVGVAVIALLTGYVRFAPTEPERWHVDPVAVQVDEQRGSGHYLLRPGDAGMPNPTYERDPKQLLSDFEDIALTERRVVRLAGSPEKGHVTYVARSGLWGFPDMISVRALPSGDGAQLAIYARQRFGSSDWGVNEARVKRWMAQLEP